MPQEIALRQNPDKNFIGRQNIKLRRRGSSTSLRPLRLSISARFFKLFVRLSPTNYDALFRRRLLFRRDERYECRREWCEKKTNTHHRSYRTSEGRRTSDT